MELRYIGNHRPYGMIVDLNGSTLKDALESGEFVEVGEDSSTNKVEEEKPDKSWTEMKIYDWIKENKIPVRYKPASDTKKYVLKKLKDKGYI